MEIGLAGDWHGDTTWARHAIKRLSENTDTILHAGDFGVWPGESGKRYLDDIDTALDKAGAHMLVTPGNHEDWDQIAGTPLEDRHGLGPTAWMRPRVGILPRAHRFTLGGRSFVSLGGAPSLDFANRTEGKTWWAAEAITDDDVERTVAGGHADVMLTHDSPGPPWATPRVQTILSTNPFGWSLRALAYAAEGQRRIDQAVAGVKPRLLVHGHMHTVDEHEVTDGTWTLRVVSLHMSGQGGNFALLETDDLSVQWLDIKRDANGQWERA